MAVAPKKEERPSIAAFQNAKVGDSVLVKRTGTKNSTGIVTKKLPGALVMDFSGHIVVINADKIIRVLTN